MGISIWQVLIVVVLIALLFGAGRIPRLMGDMAKGIKSFKQGMKDDEVEQAEASKPAGQVEQGTSQANTAQQKDPAQS